jgi:glyoxylase-like metal-dependent hydrolase (beta-lactamase superfamily II)
VAGWKNWSSWGSWCGGLVEVAEMIYAYIDSEGTWFKSNSGAIAGDEYTILIDTQYNADRMRGLLSAMENKGLPDPRVVVLTHHHGDHAWTTYMLKNAVTVCHERTARMVESMLGLDPSMYKAIFPDLDFMGARYTIPDVAFSGDKLTLKSHGAPKAEVIPVGHTHTPGDAIVYVPDHKVVFTGDLVFYNVTPLAIDAHLAGWIDALDQLLDMDADTYVPGHGPVTGEEGVREAKDYLEIVLREAERLMGSSEDLLEMAKKVNLGRFAEWKDPERIIPNLERALMEISGIPPEQPLPNVMETAMKMGQYRQWLQSK